MSFGEVGYVSNRGIGFYVHPSFRTASQAITSETQKAQSRWRTCMSGWDFSKLALPRYQLEDYRRNPGRYCGPQPAGASVESAETFQLREVAFSLQGGRRPGNVVSTFSFTDPDGILLTAERGELTNRCFMLTSSAGVPIPVRSTSDPDAFTFSNPFNRLGSQLATAQAETKTHGDRLAALESSLATSRTTLSASRAYRGGQCVRPSPGPLPARPNVMSDAAIVEAAQGSCTDVMMRRHSEAAVTTALMSIDLDDYVDDRRAWLRGSKPSCARVLHSQADDQAIRMATVLGQFAYYGAIQTTVKNCVARAVNACRAPLAAWESQVAAVRAGPEAELNQCRTLVSQIAATEADIQSTRPRFDQAAIALAAAQSAPQEQPQGLPLSQARCSS